MSSRFVPLGSSVLSSDPDVSERGLRRTPLNRIAVNINNGSAGQPFHNTNLSPFVNQSLKNNSNFSFAILPSKKLKVEPSVISTMSTTQPQKEAGFDKNLESMLLYSTENLPFSSSYSGMCEPEYLEDMLSSNETSNDLLGLPSDLEINSNWEGALMDDCDDKTRIFEDLESMLFSDKIFTSDIKMNNSALNWYSEDPFLASSNLDIEKTLFKATLNSVETTPKAGLVSVQELSRKSSDATTPLNVRVIPKRKSGKVITPSFRKKLVTAAAVSKNKEKEEKKYYEQFIQMLCTDRLVEDDEDDDDIFDLLDSKLESDEHLAEDGLESKDNTIPSRELISLFDDLAPPKPTNDLTLEVADILVDEERPANFDKAILGKLGDQLNLHFQMLVQNLALSGEVKGAEQIWIVSLKLMIRLKDFVDSKQPILKSTDLLLRGDPGMNLLLRIFRQNPVYRALLNNCQNEATSCPADRDLYLKSSVKNIPFKPRFKDGRTPCFSKSFWHILSLFGKYNDWKYALVPKDTHDLSLVDHQKQIFLDTSSSNNVPKRHDSFLAVEDRLLHLGLQRFGLGNWEKIQAALLPTRSSKQIYFRFKNLSSRRAPENPVKEFFMEIIKPLSPAEEKLLLRGYRTYRSNWDAISSHFLPHRPASVLRKMWASIKTIYEDCVVENPALEVNSTKIFQYPRKFLDAVFISDDDDSDYIDDPESNLE